MSPLSEYKPLSVTIDHTVHADLYLVFLGGATRMIWYRVNCKFSGYPPRVPKKRIPVFVRRHRRNWLLDGIGRVFLSEPLVSLLPTSVRMYERRVWCSNQAVLPCHSFCPRLCIRGRKNARCVLVRLISRFSWPPLWANRARKT